MWVAFVNDAKTCLKHYNTTHQADFVYKHDLDNGFVLVGEQDGSYYYHLNFLAQDKKGHSQLFFGEIMMCVAPCPFRLLMPVGGVSEPLRRRGSMCSKTGIQWVWMKSIATHVFQD